MSDPRQRARHFRTRAEECKKLADLALTEERKSEYLLIAEHYTVLAQAQEDYAGKIRGERYKDGAPDQTTTPS